MIKNKFVSDLRSSKVEKDVEDNYRNEIKKKYKVTIVSPFGCDGYFHINDYGVVCEFKNNKNLKDKENFLEVVAQVIFYLKKFSHHTSEYIFPTVAFMGDQNSCSIMNTNPLKPYLERNYKWDDLSPCESYRDEMLMRDLHLDSTNLNIPVFNITDNFNLITNVDPYLKRVLKQEKAEIVITDDNIMDAYNYWLDIVVKDGNVSNEDNVDIFMKMLLNAEDVFMHPKKKNTLVCIGSDKEIKIDPRGYFSFFALYREQHTIEQIKKLTACKDRLLLEKHRRRTGAFFTPKIWVDEAHRMITEQLGPNWKEEYVVWDASAGTANLTRDYKFKELYISTLEQTDIDIIKKAGFNPEATIFQFDFLNDAIEDTVIGGLCKLPEGLKKALKENKKIVFLNNPPYGTNSDWRNPKFTANKDKFGKFMIKEDMKKEGLGNSSNDLIGQFLYRIIKIKKKFNLDNSYICLFSKRNIFSSQSFRKLRSDFMDKIEFNTGFIFNVSEFTNTTGVWGVLFSIWKTLDKKSKLRKDKFEVIIKESNKDSIMDIGIKTIYNADTADVMSSEEWVKPNLKEISEIKETLILKSPLNINDTNKSLKIPVDCIGSYNTTIDNPFIFSTGQSINITKTNFDRIVSVYAANINKKNDWLNSDDLLFKPITTHPKYNQWVNDSIIVSLFEYWAYQSSLRQVTYHNQLWDLENHFFYLSNAEMRELANQNNNQPLYQDTFKYPNDRFVYNKLQSLHGQFSPDAQAVLDKGIELTRLSFPFRKDADPKFHLNSWDAGWYQIRMGILKEHFPVEYEEFRQLLLALRQRMAPLVYELGFLRK